MKHPDFPINALMQSVNTKDDALVSGYRIYIDGRYETLVYPDSAWALKNTFNFSVINEVSQLIKNTNFENIQGFHQISMGNLGDEKRLITWIQVFKNDVVITGGFEGTVENETVKKFNDALLDIFKKIAK